LIFLTFSLRNAKRRDAFASYKQSVIQGVAPWKKHFLILLLPGHGYYLALVAILALAIITAGMAEKILDRPDPGMVVIDEIIGMLIGLMGAPLTLPALVTAFVLFRLFDIWKPFPVSWLDRHLHGGTGIVLDDVMAGIYTLACMQLMVYLAVF